MQRLLMVLMLSLTAAAWADEAAPPPTPAVPGAVAPEAAAAPAQVPRVTVEFHKTEIREALARLGELTGADFIATPGVQGAITARFTNEPIDKVLRLIGLTLGVEVKLIEGVFVLRPLGDETGLAPAGLDEPVAAAPAAAATGAGALLPGFTPTAKVAEAGGPAPLVGTAQEAPAAATAQGAGQDQATRRTVPLKYRSAAEVAKALGQPYIDSSGQYHPPGERTAPAQGGGAGWNDDPYQNLPPEARVTRNGTIIMPNGTTILPSGLIVAPNGTIIQPATVPYLREPWDARWGWPRYGQPQQGGTLSGNVAGVPFGLGQNGASVGGPTLPLGDNASVTLPGVNIGNAPFRGPDTAPRWRDWGLPADWGYRPPGR